MASLAGLGRSWAWPDGDRDARQVIFRDVTHLERVYPFCRGFSCVVQAGGNMGVWPWVLSRKFETVVTFEPDPECFTCLTENLRASENIVFHQKALWFESGSGSIKNDHAGNFGAQYIAAGEGEIPMVMLDDFGLAPDLIYLDIEGAELPALKGGKQTIERHHPVIAVEDKGLSVRYGHEKHEVVEWLHAFGYRVVTSHGRDVVLC